MNTSQYVKVIDSRISSELRQNFPDGNDTSQHDLTPCHASKRTTQYLANLDISVME